MTMNASRSVNRSQVYNYGVPTNQGKSTDKN